MASARRSRRRLACVSVPIVVCLGVLLTATISIGSADPEGPEGVASCAPWAGAADADGLVPIQPLTQGNVFDHGPPRSILIVTQRQDPIALVIDRAARPVLASVDLGTNVLVGLFIGRWPQQGHRVTIESLQVTDAGVCVTAQVTHPTPGQDTADAETYPYDVVAAPLASIPQTPGTSWTVVTPDGATIASTRFP